MERNFEWPITGFNFPELFNLWPGSPQAQNFLFRNPSNKGGKRRQGKTAGFCLLDALSNDEFRGFLLYLTLYNLLIRKTNPLHIHQEYRRQCKAWERRTVCGCLFACIFKFHERWRRHLVPFVCFFKVEKETFAVRHYE